MVSSAPPPHLGWGDRLCLRWTAWTFAGLAAVVAVATVALAGAWWHVAGREDVPGAQRFWIALVLLGLGAVASLALYGLSRLCRTVSLLCAGAAASGAADRRRSAPPITHLRLPSGVGPHELQHRGDVGAGARQ